MLDPARAGVGVPGQGVTIQRVARLEMAVQSIPHQRIATLNTITVRSGAPAFQITSASVMNVFFIPNSAAWIYGMNGMVTRLELRADEAALITAFRRISGDGFPDMMFDVKVVCADGLDILPPARCAAIVC